MSIQARLAELLMLALICTWASGLLLAAPHRFVPQTFKQPDGSVLHCFASGDEYYNWLHDARGFTIVRDATTGFYVYARKEQGELLPTARVAGRDEASGAGLEPWVNITPAEIQAIRSRRIAQTGGLKVLAPTVGAINNIVVFVRFSDEPEFTDLLSLYTGMFNASVAGTSSMFNYFQAASYGSLSVTSSFYPNLGTGKIRSYKDIHPRGYYKPYEAAGNPIGYKDESESSDREAVLLKAAIDTIAAQVPAGLNIDSNNDGYVDNVCFIVSGTPTAWATLLWPHMSWLNAMARINGKWVRAYNLQIRSHLLNSGASVLSHEMGHTLGLPDLYHYTTSPVEPVGEWDLMAANSSPPQHMGAYMKYRYLRWVGDMPALSTPGRYSLRPLTSPTGNCYQIRSPYSPTEFFVVEYRKKTPVFENKIPGEGLLLYRINAEEIGNAEGPPDEVYVFRPGGSLQVNGSLTKAAMRMGGDFTLFDDLSDPRAFLSTGRPGGVRITDVSAIGDSISFTLTWPLAAVVDSAVVTALPGDSVKIEWAAAAQFRCKGFEVQSAPVDSDDAFLTLPGSFVPGAGTTAGSRKYSFVDRSASGAEYYRLQITDTSGAIGYSRSSKVLRVTGIKNGIPPGSFSLEQNYPNPFNPKTKIRFSVPTQSGRDGQVSGSSDVKLTVFDILGREVAVLVNERKAAGDYEVSFDAAGLASGVYVYRLTAGPFVTSRSMVLVK